MKTIFKHFLATAMLLLVSVSMNAGFGDIRVGGIYYQLNRTTKEAYVGYGNYGYSGEVVIPDKITYDNVIFNVTKIGNEAFYYSAKDDLGNSKLKSVSMPESIIAIENRAFQGCNSLKSLKLPNSVTTIGSSAFSGCSGLTSINIPDNLKRIENYAFEGCTGLVSINIPERVTSIGSSAFRGCSGLASINIPNSVTSIGEGAFSGCTGLTSINIPEGVTSIGHEAFSGCSGLTSITIPESVTSIGRSAFSGCSLTSVTIPESVTSIGSSAFSDCSLTSINIPKSVTTIGQAAFSCSGLTSITVNGENSIYDSRDNCNAIIETSSNTLIVGCQNTIIPLDILNIGTYAFSGCSGLNSINIPEGVTSIGDNAFSGCSGLTSITIPKSVTKIGQWAFSGCKGLTSINIPESVTSIEYGAFQNCTDLTSITIPESVTTIGADVFTRCSSLPVEDNLRYADTYLVEAVDKTLSNYNIKEGTRFIGTNAFSGCKGLTSITIPEGVTTIGARAFYGCSALRYAEFGSVEQLCNIDFNGNPSDASNPLYFARHLYIDGKEVKQLVIPEGVTNIGNCAFINCTDLTSITILDGVNSIGNNAFSNCTGLTSVTIPSSVTSIGSSAFNGCTSLGVINAQGTTPPTIVNNTFDTTTYTSAFLYIPTGCEEIYGTAEGWKNFAKIREKDFGMKDCLLTIKNCGGGFVAQRCKTMTAYSFLIQSDEGWKVSSVSFNGSDVTSELAEDGSYTTPALTGDSELSIVFEQDGNEVKEVGEDGQLRVFASGSAVTIQNNGEPQQVSVYTTDGKAVKQTIAERGNTRIPLNEGNVYLLKIGDRTFKVAM